MSTSRTLKTFLGDDCPVVVEWDYQPYEADTMEYQGVGESALIEQVLFEGHDVIETLSKITILGLEEQCLEAEHEA